MKKVIEFFKNRIVIAIIGLIVLSLLIWFVGPAIKFGEKNYAPLGSEVVRLVVIMVIIVLWGLNNLRVSHRDKKQNDELVSDLEQSQSSANDLLGGQTSEEMHQISERFSNALATLRKLKFKGKGSSRRALYELPWYIIIGPPGSGKTTALVNSSLDFPLAHQFGKGALQGVGGTRNCDWWFTNEAVLIDTAGRYTTQDSHKVIDSSAWDGFLNLLKRHRRRRPINGAIVAISLQDILTQTEEERIKHAKTIRSRIDELMERLEIRFPIYLMFTKSDLVSGFSEFFEDLGKEDREQVWGVSLPNAPKVSQSPDFDYFDSEFQSLIKRLYDRVIWRVHQERDVKRRAAIAGFPQQLENLKSVINKFVNQTFIKNRYRFQPYLRGVYFSSGTQDGTPIDRLMSSVSANFGFSREMMAPAYNQGKSFFLGHLFRQVIFPEAELVGSNRRYENFIRWSQRIAYASMALVMVGLTFAWFGSYGTNVSYMKDVKTYVDEFNEENKKLTKWTSDIRAVLPSLNALANASIVYDQQGHPFLSSFGMYDSNVDDAADRAYREQLKRIYLPRLINYLEIYLNQGHISGDLYSTFRTYVMFQKLEHMNKQQVQEWFFNKWDETMEGEATRRDELKFHLKALLALELKPSSLNKTILANTRATLLKVPVAERIYQRIRTNPKYTQKIDLMREYGEPVREHFIGSPEVSRNLMIPYLFTKKAYDELDFSADNSVISSIVNERWLLDDNDTQRVDFAKQDLADVSKRVKELYLTEYLATWNKVYASLDVKNFQNLRQANDVLTSFSDPVYSPLIAILTIGKENTQLSPLAVAQSMADGNNTGVAGAVTNVVNKNVELNKVDSRFRDLNLLLREKKNQPPAVTTILTKITQVKEYVSEIALAPNPSQQAFAVAKARFQSGSGNAISALQTYAKTQPEPIRRWLDALSEQSWRVVLGSAHGHVKGEWRTRVYRPYANTLAGRFPLKKTAETEVALQDFVEFFKAGGIMDQFEQEFIAPFRGGKGYIGLSSAAINQVEKARLIRSYFLKKNPEIPSMSFQLTPYKMPANDVRFTLEIGNNRISYSHGPKIPKPMKWSAGDDQERVRLIFEDLNEQEHPKEYHGPWAWFKLLYNSKIQRTTHPNIYLVTFGLTGDGNSGSGIASPLNVPYKHQITFQLKVNSSSNFFKNDPLSTFSISENL